jgi:hypothetical protein
MIFFMVWSPGWWHQNSKSAKLFPARSVIVTALACDATGMPRPRRRCRFGKVLLTARRSLTRQSRRNWVLSGQEHNVRPGDGSSDPKQEGRSKG